MSMIPEPSESLTTDVCRALYQSQFRVSKEVIQSCSILSSGVEGNSSSDHALEPASQTLLLIHILYHMGAETGILS